MANEKCRNVLLTTMSILISDSKINYYYFEDNGIKRYCDGISALEPGTKYYLSKYPIDEIVVIGTKETRKEEDAESEVGNLMEAWGELAQDYRIFKEKKQLPMAFEFYKYRIAAFLREAGMGDEHVKEEVEKEIDSGRREELKELLAAYSGGDSVFLMPPESWKELRDEIKKSIEQGFEKSETYSDYVKKKEELLTKEEEYASNEQLAWEYRKRRERIAKDETLSLLERQYLYASLKRVVEESIFKNRLMEMEAEIIELQKERDRLNYEIETIRRRRVDSEFSYVQYLAYCNLNEKHRLLPLQENFGLSDKGITVRFVDEQFGNDKESLDNINGIVKAL